MRKILTVLAASLWLAGLGCQNQAVDSVATSSPLSAKPLDYELLVDHAWKQLTRSAGKFSLCRFSLDESSPTQLRVTLTTGNGDQLQGSFRFTDKDATAERRGLFVLENGLIEEPVVVRLMSDEQSLVIVDSMGEQQKLRRQDKVSRSR